MKLQRTKLTQFIE